MFSRGAPHMSQDIQQDHISKKVVVYRIPGVDGVKVRRDVAYRVTDAGALTMDIYYPPDFKSGTQIPAIFVVTGFPDLGFEAKVGFKFKELGSSISWARLMAASGMAAITYTNREPAADIHAAIHYVRQNAVLLGIDETRIGLGASSGNV